MLALIPHFIYKQYQAGRGRGRFDAASLFVDISGFTALTETLMQHHRDGAEVLTDVLNQIFAPIVHQVYARGGFITTFAGDAFTAVFPLRRDAEQAALHAAHAALFIQRFFAQYGQMQTRYGDFQLGVKIGLGAGPAQWGILGAGGQHAYYFRGPAIDSCAQAEHAAETGEVVVAPAAAELLGAHARAARAGPQVKLVGLDLNLPAKRVALQPVEREALRPFVLDAAIDLAASRTPAEFRKVACAFISFDAPGDRDLNAFTVAVLERAADYGYFNKLDFGDKGAVMLVLFGAPTAHENELARAADFLLALPGRGLNVRWRAGLTFGTVYAGIVGGPERCEYTAIGDVVNLAARLAMQADWGAVWLRSEEAVSLAGSGYQSETVGRFVFKGKGKAIAVLRLLGKPESPAENDVDQRALIGRESELADLLRWIQPVFENKFAGVMYILGEAGMGKSRLVYELQRQLALAPPVSTLQAEEGTRGRLKWFTCPADETLRRPFTPFKRFLYRYFLPGRSGAESLTRFNAALEALTDELRPQAPQLCAELERTRSCLAALVDLYWPGSLYERLEPRLRYENTLAAFKALIRAECLRQPVVIHIEDAQWLDADSQAMLQALTSDMADVPLGVLLSGRRSPASAGVDMPQQVIELTGVSPESARTIAVRALGGEMAENLAAWLVEKAEGNPFFVEQLALDLRERGALRRDPAGRWTMAPGDHVQVPTGISAVLAARLDRLTQDVRQVVQSAAVLGREFDVPVLDELLDHDQSLPLKLSLAEQQAIWSALSEMRYMFRHALLRDTAYEMQLLARRRELHSLAIVALEHVYAADLAPHYGELAYHAEHSQDPDLQRRYYRLAGDAARSAFATAAALDYYRRLLPLVDDPLDQAQISLKIADVLGLDSQYQAAIAQLKPWSERLSQAPGSHAQSIYVAVQVLLGRLYAEIGDLDGTRRELQDALRVARSSGNRRDQAQALSQLGRVALWQGAFQEAQRLLQEALPLARVLDDVPILVFALRQLGNVGNCLGQYAEAHAFLQESLQLAQQSGDLDAISAAYSSLGSNVTNQGDYAQALVYLQEAIQLARQMGNRYLIANYSTDLCNTYYLQGDYAALQRAATEALELGLAIGSRQQMAWALAHLGVAAVALRQLEPARHYLQASVLLCQQIGDRPRLMLDLIAFAWLLVHSHQPEPAAELLGTVLAQPATQDETRREALKVLGQLRAEGALSPAQLDAALQRGQALSLDQALQTHLIKR